MSNPLWYILPKGQGKGMMFSQSVETHDKGCHKREDMGSNTLYVRLCMKYSFYSTVSITRYPSIQYPTNVGSYVNSKMN